MNRTLSAPSCPRTILDSYSNASEHSQQNLAISLTNSDTATENQAFEMKELEIFSQTLKCLGPFNKLSETMSGETYVTTSMIIAELKFIETKLVVKEDDISLSKDLKDALKQSYDHYCNIYDLESNDFLIASTLLHPFYKEFEFVNRNERNFTI
ncbi:hypothetical protein BpHYR1_053773 [Brachionus plicatilis]|uniref:Zinc finger BED domain-containing 4-like n=1 Tax=Brachionus plicatilis TaxID=10195 RepID=A0A3M7QYA5_BRAPC|nr:hypothetical protein BpHYR1_053773 [Brachionus plicatilis]